MNPKIIVVTLLALFVTSPAAAQQPLAAGATSLEFIPRYDFHLSAAALAHADTRFSWDTHFGGDIDVVDYVVGRTSGIINYQAVLGNEFRPFDPNQGNYILEVATSYRIGKTEIAGMFHHVSRHLSDRPKRIPVAWNILGVRVLRQATFRGMTLDFVGEVGGATQKVNVDYTWSGNIDLVVRRDLHPHVGIFAGGVGHVMGVTSDVSGIAPELVAAGGLPRQTQFGGLAEGGVRFNGTAGAVEFFAGFERRFDADPLDFKTEQWAMVGFRILRR